MVEAAFILSSSFLTQKAIFAVGSWGSLTHQESGEQFTHLLTVDLSKLVMFFCGLSTARGMTANRKPPIHFLLPAALRIKTERLTHPPRPCRVWPLPASAARFSAHRCVVCTKAENAEGQVGPEVLATLYSRSQQFGSGGSARSELGCFEYLVWESPKCSSPLPAGFLTPLPSDSAFHPLGLLL